MDVCTNGTRVMMERVRGDGVHTCGLHLAFVVDAGAMVAQQLDQLGRLVLGDG